MGDIFGDIGEFVGSSIILGQDRFQWSRQVLVRPSNRPEESCFTQNITCILGHLMHGGLVDDEGLDYDELRQGPTNRSIRSVR